MTVLPDPKYRLRLRLPAALMSKLAVELKPLGGLERRRPTGPAPCNQLLTRAMSDDAIFSQPAPEQSGATDFMQSATSAQRLPVVEALTIPDRVTADCGAHKAPTLQRPLRKRPDPLSSSGSDQDRDEAATSADIADGALHRATLPLRRRQGGEMSSVRAMVAISCAREATPNLP